MFRKGVSHFERKFYTEGGIALQPLLVSENLVIALSCALFGTVTRVLQTDRQMDINWTDRITIANTALE